MFDRILEINQVVCGVQSNENLYTIKCGKDFRLNQTIVFQLGKVFVELDNKKLVGCNEFECKISVSKEADKSTFNLAFN